VINEVEEADEENWAELGMDAQDTFERLAIQYYNENG